MAEENEPVFQIQRVYLKDASLEIPHAPKIFLEAKQPTVDVSLGVESESVAEGVFEVAVTTTVETKIDDKVAFLCECKQGGIFEVRNIPADQMEMLQNIVCPNIIYPYLRSNVADLIQRAGFPPIHLAEINFEALYQQKLAQQQGGQAGQSDDGPSIIVPPGSH
jgi:preprotein translocase subunit SecB